MMWIQLLLGLVTCKELQHTTTTSEAECGFVLNADFPTVPEAESWYFDVFEFAGSHPDDFVSKMTGHVMGQIGTIKSLRIDTKLLSSFLEDIQKSYLGHVPYHNAVHATDIVQAVFYTLCRGDIGSRLVDTLAPDESAALIFAALGHDINHQGLTNHFLRVTDHDLAQIDSESPNESMHWRVFSEKLTQWKLLDHLEPVRRLRLMELIRVLILATNMDHHAEILSDWKVLEPVFTFDDPTHRQALMRYILKFADISNPARPKALYDKWTWLLREEYHQEGDRMKTLGLDVDPMRSRQGQSTVINLQEWFIKNRVLLYLKNIHQFGPKLSEPADELQRNLNQWQKRHAR